MYLRISGISFAGVTKEEEDDVRYFVETYQRPLRSVTILADEQGVLTDGYQVGAVPSLCVVAFVLALSRARYTHHVGVSSAILLAAPKPLF